MGQDMFVFAHVLWLVNGAMATFFFVAMAWISVTFFAVEDDGARRGKRMVSLVAGGGAIYALASYWTGVMVATGSLLVSFALYAWAVVMLFWAWRANIRRRLDFVFSGRTPTHLNRSGPYRWVRHPFYSSYSAAWIASTLGTGDLIVGGVTAALVGLYCVAAHREEQAFAATNWGEEYSAYRKEVGMFVPRLPVR